MNGDHWREQARASRLSSFPIIIVWNPAKTKWDKRPLTPHGHLDASFDVERFDWRGANGFGARMGEIATGVGYYALDVDDVTPGGPPDLWLRQRAVPPTRVHRTVRGGKHLIFALPGKHARLPSRTNIVAGLDARGEGGWAAFGDGYAVEVDVAPALLPSTVCEEIWRGYSGGISAGEPRDPVVLQPLKPVDAKAVRRKLDKALWHGAVAKSLLRAWGGQRKGGDTSRSGNDHALGCNLALAGFDRAEITHILMHEFRHGVAARDGVDARVIRAARRSAEKALAYAEQHRAALEAQPGGLGDFEEEYLRSLARGDG